MENVSSDLSSLQKTKKLTDLLADSINLATYAVEIGRLPESVSFSDLYRMWEQKVEKDERLSEQDVDYLQYCYQQLEIELSPVSAISLKATDVQGARNHKDYMNTEAGKYAKYMWITAFSILALMIGINLYQYTFDMYAGDWAVNNTDIFGGLTIAYWLAASLTPFAYGAFGAAVRMLRITETRLRERSFDPRRLAEHRNRLVLGTLSGGVIVLVYSSGGVGDTDVKLTEAALGFLAGYSIDLLFSLLDKLVTALSPADEQTKAVKHSEKTISTIPKSSFAEREIDKPVTVVSATDNTSKIKTTAHLSSVQETDILKNTSTT